MEGTRCPLPPPRLSFRPHWRGQKPVGGVEICWGTMDQSRSEASRPRLASRKLALGCQQILLEGGSHWVCCTPWAALRRKVHWNHR